MSMTRLPVVEAGEVLRSASIDGIDNICLYRVPPETQDASDSTTVLLTEVTEDLTNYGSDKFQDRNQSVELQIFFSNKEDVDIDSIERQIESIFLEKKWRIRLSRAHTVDPTTEQLVKIYYLDRTERNDF
ncbi:DUF806 family protein [Lactobacillus jensenii]|uniref:DUF806 family protein n=1 Tax=Lactobacillus jensenii TaxID=109790 RepID=A0ABU9FMA6_LACJE|nr:DUF806 family protein [Lactobacillus jensenii]TVV06638.1 DUF806 family protein [Lactobacillus paragasseri]MCZ3724053.1 DUF806 family protein [Lactobacillus jensenii]MCZ3725530.1 DUF806 family protein [Lactobacillus jensenii]MCZ3727296.1 DUF806 family protein [Lactobacillus jensenii]MCZ3728608.1 DUF806 family protein [Lactobacillus jensenii]